MNGYDVDCIWYEPGDDNAWTFSEWGSPNSDWFVLPGGAACEYMTGSYYFNKIFGVSVPWGFPPSGVGLLRDEYDYWYIYISTGYFGPYGKSGFAHAVWKSTTTASTPVGLTYSYVTLLTNTYASGDTYPGTGTPTVTAL